MFNAEYVCKISSIVLTYRPATDAGGTACIEVAVTFCVRGDGSLGDLQFPRYSKLRARVVKPNAPPGESQVRSTMNLAGPVVALVERNRSRCFRGTLMYSLPTSALAALQPGDETVLSFQYGSDGYSSVAVLVFAFRPQQVGDSPSIDPTVLTLPAHPAFVSVAVQTPASRPRFSYQEQ